MVKLLRISSENNGTFKADLDAEIEIKENASICLQNLTFETLDFTAFRVNGNNQDVGFNFGKRFGGDQTIKLTALLDNKSYTNLNITDFYKDLEATLNKCLGVGRDSDLLGQAYANFRIYYYKQGQIEGPENPTIMYKLSPPILMFNFNDTGDPRQNNGFNLFQRSRNASNDFTLNVNLTGDSINMGDMTQIVTGSATNTFSNFIYNQGPNIEWCRGSAMFMARVHNLVDNTGTADTNGFSIGLSFTELQEATETGQVDIPNTARDFEIRVKRPTDAYEYVEPTFPHTNQISGLTPLNFLDAGPQAANDHLLIERKQGQIIGSVLNTSVANGLKTILFTYTLTREELQKPMYPYIAVFGEQANAKVGRPMVTINPIIKPFNDNTDQVNNKYYNVIGIKQALFDSGNVYSSLGTNYNNVVPQLENRIFDEDPSSPKYPENYNPQLTINAEVLRALSFNPDYYKGNQDYVLEIPQTLLSINDQDEGRAFLQFDLVSEGLSNLVNSDNYIVILDSNPLFSYDASKFDYTDPDNSNFNKYSNRGRRINILATIPVNDNNGFVEYEPNELTFIDFDNRFPQSLKNIKLRVLDKDFNEIKTTGESIMTLLIKDA